MKTEEGEERVFSVVDERAGVSLEVYKRKNFKEENPVYHVRVWDDGGNGGMLTERTVDISKIDLQDCDEIDMYAYVVYLGSSGRYTQAFWRFCSVQAYCRNQQEDDSFERVFQKKDWINIVKEFMQMQYDAGNIKGYMDYKKLLGLMEE